MCLLNFVPNLKQGKRYLKFYLKSDTLYLGDNMSNMLRKFKRKEEKDKQINIRNTYGKKPKGICPKCRRKTLFMTNKDGEVYCIRCDNRVK